MGGNPHGAGASLVERGEQMVCFLPTVVAFLCLLTGAMWVQLAYLMVA